MVRSNYEGAKSGGTWSKISERLGNRNVVDVWRLITSIITNGATRILYAGIARGAWQPVMVSLPSIRGRNGVLDFGKSGRFYGCLRVLFDDPGSAGHLRFGDRLTFEGPATISPRGGIIEIGSDCFVGSNVLIQAFRETRIVIGNGVLLAASCCIVASNHVYRSLELPIRLQGEQGKGIAIEDDVWLGCNVTVLDGCRIGQGAVIAAGAVVTTDIESYGVFAGVPARKIGSRLPVAS